MELLLGEHLPGQHVDACTVMLSIMMVQMMSMSMSMVIVQVITIIIICNIFTWLDMFSLSQPYKKGLTQAEHMAVRWMQKNVKK